MEQTGNDNGGENEDVCVRDNGKAQRKKSRGRADQVASAVGNEDGEGD